MVMICGAKKATMTPWTVGRVAILAKRHARTEQTIRTRKKSWCQQYHNLGILVDWRPTAVNEGVLRSHSTAVWTYLGNQC